MIPKAIILAVAKEESLRDTTIEKDYVLGWMLHGIAQHPRLRHLHRFQPGEGFWRSPALRTGYPRFLSAIDRQVVPYSPAAAVRGPKHSVPTGLTPIMEKYEARALLDSIDGSTLAGARDKALIAVMLFSFARIGAVIGMRVRDYRGAGSRNPNSCCVRKAASCARCPPILRQRSMWRPGSPSPASPISPTRRSGRAFRAKRNACPAPPSPRATPARWSNGAASPQACPPTSATTRSARWA